jgi:galactonate dehydratase
MRTRAASVNDRRRAFLSTLATGFFGASAAVRIGRGDSAVSAWTGTDTNSLLNQARPMEKGTLKIVKVEPMIMRFRRNEQGHLGGNFCLVCRIETDEGLVGWGEGTNFPKVAPIATEIEMNAPSIVGRSAWDIEKIWYTLYRGRNAMHGSAVQSAISAVDIALWDIVGQKLNVPTYRLLGGKVNDKLKKYLSSPFGRLPRTPEAYGKRTKELVAQGALAGKWDPFITPEGEINLAGTDYNLPRQATLHTINETRALVRAVREAGPDFEICVEAHAKFNVGSAVRIAKAIEEFNPMFLEEPVPPENVDAMLEVQRATSIPIAAGERLKSRLEARDYLEREAIRLYQPDAARIGGITEFRKAIAMAESHFIPVAPHNPNGIVCFAAHLHLSASASNFVIFEEGIGADTAACREAFGAWQESPAYFWPLETPGIGLRGFTPAFVKDHVVDRETAERDTAGAAER